MADKNPNTPPPQRPVPPLNPLTTHGEGKPPRPTPPDNQSITEGKKK